MKTTLLTILIAIALTSGAQIKMWYGDYNKAKDHSKESGKLMVIDFWAEWCNPCIEMDKKLWKNPEVLINSQNFIPVKIDVMLDRNTPERFNVEGIPKVVIAMADGTVIWERTGFYSADDFLGVLNSVPGDVTDLYKCFYNINALSKDTKCACDIAVEFQKLAKNISNNELKNSFIQRGNEYFKKAKKYNTSPEIVQDLDLYLLLNDVYKGNPEKVLKKFNKKYKSAKNCDNPDLAHFLLANCYKQMNDLEKFTKESALIENEELLAQLD